MGNICNFCIREKDKYSSVGNDELKVNTVKEFDNALIQEFGLKASIFEGSMVEQKFTSKQVFELKFVWVNLDARTIHMSTHDTKESRHKEASLTDVTSVERGEPKRMKIKEVNSSSCLTVNFQRGGGIDLRFKSDAECDEWFLVLNRIVKHLMQTPLVNKK
jgi:hypothetical protein